MLNVIAGTFSVGVPPIPPSSYESIQTVTVAAGGTSYVEFTSIPSTFTHLQIRLLARCTRTADGSASTYMQFNSDTGSNYSRHTIYAYGSGSTIYTDSAANSSYLWVNFTGTDFLTSGIFSVGVIDILEYKNTNIYKTIKALGGDSTNSAQDQMAYHSGNWRNTNAITSIKLYPNINNFAQYSQFALYGIKGV